MTKREDEGQPATNGPAPRGLDGDQDTGTLPPAPVLNGYRDPDGMYLHVWCPHEQRWHRHGFPCSCDWVDEHGEQHDECVCPPGLGDGHRGAHCTCRKSSYAGTGYVVREAGPLTAEVLAEHQELSYLRGCRWDSCRLSRAAHLRAAQQPGELPPPDDPLAVAQQLVKGYAAIDYTDGDPVDEAAAWRDMWGPDMPEAPVRDYDVTVDGPLTLRRWRGSWFQWLGPRWVELEADDLNAQLYERLGNAHYVKRAKDGTGILTPWRPNRSRVGEVLAALGSLTLLDSAADAPAWLDKYHPDKAGAIVACTNGLLDTGSRELREHDPSWFNLVSVPFDYHAAARPPARWLAFLASLWPDDPAAVESLQQWFGYILTGRTDLQKIMLIVGPPRSGKGTIARVLQELVGRTNAVGPTLASLSTNFGLQPLIGKPLAIVADARLGGRDTHTVVERLLSISGEDALTVDRKYRDPWTGRLPTRLMVLSNELPHFGDASGAIATRFLVLSLTQSWLGKEDTGLEHALHAELPGILNWALDGLTALQAQGRFTEPPGAGEAVLTMADSASPTGAFVRDCCKLGAGLEVPAAQLYAAWRAWCFDNGRDHPGNQQTFGRTLRSVVPAIQLRHPRDPQTGKQVRTYAGITLMRGDARTNPLFAGGVVSTSSWGGDRG